MFVLYIYILLYGYFITHIVKVFKAFTVNTLKINYKLSFLIKYE